MPSFFPQESWLGITAVPSGLIQGAKLWNYCKSSKSGGNKQPEKRLNPFGNGRLGTDLGSILGSAFGTCLLVSR